MGKHYDNLEEAMCKELEMLDKKYGTDTAEMTIQDLEKADKLYHALKSAATYHAMKDAEEWDDEEEPGEGRSYRGGRSYGRGYGRSYARRRDSMGRYTSRGMGPDDFMEGDYSGYMPYYPQRRFY